MYLPFKFGIKRVSSPSHLSFYGTRGAEGRPSGSIGAGDGGAAVMAAVAPADGGASQGNMDTVLEN